MRHRLAALLAAIVAAVATPTTTAAERNVLWSVRGQANTVYLFGSIHALRPDDVGLPRAVENAYADAEQLVMEIDMDDPATADPAAMAMQMQRAARLPDGQSLQTVLGDDYGSIASRARESGLDLAAMDDFAPWLVAIILLQLEMTRLGFATEHGIEQQLADRAVSDGKPILGLETPEEQFAVLGGLSLAQQKRFLLMTLEESAHADANLENLLAAWRTGDTAALAEVLSEEFDAFPELYRPLTEERNRAWVGQLADLLDDRHDYLVVIGALHLVGRNSVVEMLAQRGYAVTQH